MLRDSLSLRWLLLTGALLLPARNLQAGEVERELLRDSAFALGFHVLSPTPGQRVVADQVRFGVPDAAPVWDIAQWSSRQPLAAADLHRRADGAWVMSNAAKSVSVASPGEASVELTLGVDSRTEFDRPRRQGEPWPHLLVQQAIEDCPPLSELVGVTLRLGVRLDHNQVFRGQDYRRDLHCAQCPLVLIAQNRNAASPGYGDFFWLLVPLFDDRWPAPPPHIAQDTADPSAKLIFNPGWRAYTDQTLTEGTWMGLQVDLLPHLLAGLRVAGEKGCLPGSNAAADFRITSFILGWEVPGMNRAQISFRNLSLRVTPAAALSLD